MRSTRQRAHSSIIALLTLAAAAGAQTVNVPAPESTVRWHDVSVEDYRQHLAALSSLVDSCAKARNVSGCDPALVGPDDRVPILIGSRSESRMVRYGWLRVLFSKAQDADQQPTKNTGKKSVSTKPEGVDQELPSASQLLKGAKTRLERDLAQSRAPEPAVADHTQAQAAMQQVLAGPDFRNLKQATVSDSVLEKLGRWLNKIFESAASLKAHSAWLGRALVWGFILGVCVALVFSLVRLERRWRVKLTPDDDRPAPGAASARDWQLWLEDARRCAALGKWREAIHFVYWAAISRLESRRLWPADRARTPREYLALVAPEDPRRPGLSQLTSTFERFWYGGRPAAESDYRSAETVASTLMSGGASSANAASLSAAQDGGAQ